MARHSSVLAEVFVRACVHVGILAVQATISGLFGVLGHFPPEFPRVSGPVLSVLAVLASFRPFRSVLACFRAFARSGVLGGLVRAVLSVRARFAPEVRTSEAVATRLEVLGAEPLASTGRPECDRALLDRPDSGVAAVEATPLGTGWGGPMSQCRLLGDGAWGPGRAPESHHSGRIVESSQGRGRGPGGEPVGGVGAPGF